MRRILPILVFALVFCGCAQPPPPASGSTATGAAAPVESPAAPAESLQKSSPGGTAPVPAGSPAVPFVQWSGQNGGRQATGARVLRTVADWDEFWRSVHQPQPRALEPDREMAVVVDLGERRSGGYRVEITRIAPQEQRLVVEYREHAPAPDMMVTQALTTPWAVAMTSRSEAPIELRRTGAAAAREQR